MTKRYREEAEVDSINLANVLILLSRGGGDDASIGSSGCTSGGRLFECKTCSRQFGSFQALGGHRASHKMKPRTTCERISEETQKRDKVHECSICGLEFAMGQELGGHMRRHRAARGGFVGRRVVLDLNLPPLELELEEDEECRNLGLGLGLVCR